MSRPSEQPVAVIGAGSWGTALAVHLAGSGCAVRLWGRDSALVAEMAAERTNQAYLPGIRIPAGVCPSPSLDDVLANAAYVVLAVPSHGLRATLHRAASLLPPDAVLV